MRKLTVFLVLAAFFVACDNSETTNVQAPAPMEPTPPQTVTAAGSCRPLTAGFQCCDDSSCREGNTSIACREISWAAESVATGIRLDTEIGEPKGCVQFNGVPSGDYAIEQTATSPDGSAVDTEPHNVTVP